MALFETAVELPYYTVNRSERLNSSRGESLTESPFVTTPLTGRPPPTAEEWEQVRPIFTELYSTRDMKLDDVKEELQQKHAFYATKRMYNKRIRDWNIQKNYKRAEKIAMIYALKTRKPVKTNQTDEVATSSDALRTFKGRPIKAHRLVRYCKENGLDENIIDEIQNVLDQFNQDEEQHSSRTLPKRSDPHFLAVLDPNIRPYNLITEYGDTRDFEFLLNNTFRYVTGYLKDASRYSNSIVGLKIAHIDGGRAVKKCDLNPYVLEHDCIVASMLLDRGLNAAAFQIFDQTMDRVRLILSEQSPCLIDGFAQMLNSNLHVKGDLKSVLQNHVANMAIAILGERHPLTAIYGTLQRLVSQNAWEFIWPGLTAIFRAEFGPRDDTVLAMSCRLVDSFGNEKGFSKARQHLSIYAQYTDCLRTRLLKILWGEHLLLEEKRYEEAELVIEGSLDTISGAEQGFLEEQISEEDSVSRDVSIHVLLYCLGAAAFYLGLSNKATEAFDYCMRQIRLAQLVYGPISAETFLALIKGEEFLASYGSEEMLEDFQAEHAYLFQEGR